jgi:cyanophycinase-like exopeptidase
MKHILYTIVLLFVFSILSVSNAKTTYYITGDPSDVGNNFTLGGPVLDLGGGGTDVLAAFQQTVDIIRGCGGSLCGNKIDIVILRATGTGAYNNYLYALNGVNSVQTYVLTKLADANNAATETVVKNAEFVFYAGGNQCDYTTFFKGTKMESATRFVYNKGGAVGGTSAGMAIMGEYDYNGCNSASGTTSSQALANPYDTGITFTYNYFNFSFMNLIITDDHYITRDRMGRLLTFMARQIKDGKTSVAWGLAANEETSVVVDKFGLATVVRNDGTTYDADLQQLIPASLNPVAYFILADHMPTTCVSGSPLSYSGYKVWKRTYGQTFNLASRPTVPDYTLNVVAGALSVVGNGGNIY